MILTCPSCSASYNVPNEAIGIDGRMVRCKKCKHEWFQDGEKQALEELINMVEATDINLDALAFDDGKSKRKSIPQANKPKAKLSLSFKAVWNKIIPAKIRNWFVSGGKRDVLSHFASFMVALAVFSCLLLALVTWRSGITHIFPSLINSYEAAGFPLTNYARLNPESALIIDRISFQGEGQKREIVGNLINLTSQNIKVPLFKVSYLDQKGGILKEISQNLPISIIQKELNFSFSLPVPESIPPNVSSVHISFADEPAE